jgi:2-amino-4-hydroxy-6-hydroxymethyldihydropteridine diphosphokinase
MKIETMAGADKDLESVIVVALGSNLKGEWASSISVLEVAKAHFSAAGLKILECSSYWRSTAWPDPTQPDYINAVALVETRLDPEGTLLALHGIEAEFGRVRMAPNAPRVLDLDLIAYGRLVRTDAAPILPHPRAAERRFVMGPLAEIAPTWRHPVSGARADVLGETARVGADAQPVTPALIKSLEALPKPGVIETRDDEELPARPGL